MIVILDVTDPKLSILTDEFVRPLEQIMRRTGTEYLTVHISCFDSIPDDVTGILISGTAIADSWYTSVKPVGLLGRWGGPVLGICAGMQILLSHSGGVLCPSLEIGMTEIKVTSTGEQDPLTCGYSGFSGYALHQQTVTIPDGWMILAESEECPHIVKNNTSPLYGVLFHPEVRNEWLIERFIRLSLGFTH